MNEGKNTVNLTKSTHSVLTKSTHGWVIIGKTHIQEHIQYTVRHTTYGRPHNERLHSHNVYRNYAFGSETCDDHDKHYKYLWENVFCGRYFFPPFLTWFYLKIPHTKFYCSTYELPQDGYIQIKNFLAKSLLHQVINPLPEIGGEPKTAMMWVWPEDQC